MDDAGVPPIIPITMSLFLIGYRGSGKTTVGQHVARRLKLEFADSDSIVTAAADMTIKEIFEKHGEDYFRTLETAAVKDLCNWVDAVIALGGGAVMREVNRQAIRDSGFPVIYLHADAQTLHDRIHGDPQTQATRPSLTHLGGSVDEVKELLAKRLPIYREMCTHEIDVTDLSIKEAADRVVELIERV
jgi:shikimate kinase